MTINALVACQGHNIGSGTQAVDTVPPLIHIDGSAVATVSPRLDNELPRLAYLVSASRTRRINTRILTKVSYHEGKLVLVARHAIPLAGLEEGNSLVLSDLTVEN